MKLRHITISTAKFEEEISFYENVIGLTKQKDLRSLGLDIVFLANGENETCIEIIKNEKVTSCENNFLSIGFKCDN
ncbi:MAG: VOC family protein, partial [Anaerotignaceae bacterium]